MSAKVFSVHLLLILKFGQAILSSNRWTGILLPRSSVEEEKAALRPCLAPIEHLTAVMSVTGIGSQRSMVGTGGAVVAAGPQQCVDVTVNDLEIEIMARREEMSPDVGALSAGTEVSRAATDATDESRFFPSHLAVQRTRCAPGAGHTACGSCSWRTKALFFEVNVSRRLLDAGRHMYVPYLMKCDLVSGQSLRVSAWCFRLIPLVRYSFDVMERCWMFLDDTGSSLVTEGEYSRDLVEEDLQGPLQAGMLSPGIGVCMLLLRKDLFDGHRDFNHIVDKKVIIDRLQSDNCEHQQ